MPDGSRRYDRLLPEPLREAAQPAPPSLTPQVPAPRRGSVLGNRATEALVARLRAQASPARELSPTIDETPDMLPEEASYDPDLAVEPAASTDLEPPDGAPPSTAAGKTETAEDAAPAAQPRTDDADAATAPDAPAEDQVEAAVDVPDGPEVPEAAASAGSDPATVEAEPAATPQDLPEPVPEAATQALPDEAGGEEADGPGPELAQWRSRVAGATSGIPEPALVAAPAAAGAVRARGGALRGGRAGRRAAIPDEAQAATPDAPQPVEPPPEPPPDPVPGANDLVEAEAKHRLADVTMPDLVLSPRGTQPLVRDPALAPAPEPAPESEVRFESEETVGPPAPTEEDAAAIEDVQAATEAPVPEPIPGTAEGATLEDIPPEPRPPLPPQISNIMREVVARLLADPAPEAERILQDARRTAYPNGVLPDVYRDIGSDRLAGLTESLTTSLRAVATEAGVAADELDAAVNARRAAVQSEAEAATSDIATAQTDETGEMETESGEEVAEVEAAEDAEHAHASGVVEAATGEGSPQVINARRDQQIRKINRRVGTIRFEYDRARDRRHAALDRQHGLQVRAYDTTSTEDQAAIAATAPDGEPGFTEVLEQGGIRNWAEAQKRTLGERVRKLKADATTETEGFKRSVSTAGDTGIEQVRTWAEAQTGETRSWWQQLWQTFFDWSQRANAEAENWSAVRAGEARDATLSNMGLLQGFVDSQGEAVDLETNEAFKALSGEQQAVIRAYYASPPGNRDALGAVAAGLSHRIAAEQKASIIESMKLDVLAKPDSEAWNLEQIGKAESSSFSAERISSELYEAMFGGVTGLGTDEEQIYSNLSGLTQVQGRAVRAMYRMDHDRNLDSDLASELDEDNALIRAKAALDGDPVMEAVGALNEAMAGPGTDEDTVMRMLRGKTAEQRERIEEEYFRRYGVRLRAELDDEMSGHDFERADALRVGDVSRADAIALDQAMHGGWFGLGTDEAQIESVYSDIRGDVASQQVPDGKGGMRPMTQEEMEAEVARRNLQVEASYNDRYGSPGDQESALRAAYRSELSGPELDLATALADNDLVGADAARLEVERRGFYTDDDVVNGILENQYNRSLDGLRRDPAWRERHSAVDRQVEERARAGNPMTPWEIDAAHRAIEREMEQAAREGGAANMAALETRYDSRYSTWGRGGLQTMIAFNMSGTDREKAQALREQGGYLSRAQQVDFATRGLGTNEAAFERATTGLTAAEIEDLNTDLAAMGRPTVQEIAADELDGREAQDARVRLRGVPENAEEELAQARMKVQWELANSPVGGHERKVMQARMARMEQQYALINDPDADPFERQRALAQFQSRGTGVQAGVDAYRAQVDAITDAVATAAALTVAITVTVLTGGIAGAVLGALYAAATTIVVKSVLKGGAYGADEMAVDAIVGVVDAAAAAATFGVGNAMLRVLKEGGERFGRIGASRLAGALSRMATSGSRVQRMLAHGIAEAAEGAAGALPSALAGNMLNDKNWEHGNPFVNIVSGTLVETGMGAAMGGAMGSLGGFHPPHVDPPVPKTGDILAHRGTPADRLAAWKAHKAENPDADMRMFLRQYDDQVAARLAAESRDATVQRALRGELLSGLPPAQRGAFADVPIEVMSDADFKALTRSDSGNAVTMIRNGEPVIVLRDGAPPGVLREEGIHLSQLADPDLGPLVRRLDESRLGRWDDLPLAEKLELYAIKVELEIDAQRKLIAGLEADIRRAPPRADTSGLQTQKVVAEGSLSALEKRAGEVAGLGPLDRIAMARGLRDPPPFLDQPARLFTKAEPPKAGDVDSPLRRKDVFKPGDEIRIVQAAEAETSVIQLSEDARIEVTLGGERQALIVHEGNLHYAGPPQRAVPVNTKIVDEAGGIPEFTYSRGRTVHVEQRYRVVEHVRPDPAGGPPRVLGVRGEAESLSHSTLEPGGWVQRGSENVRKGREAELASQRLSAERVADPNSDVVATFQVQRPDGTGFDGVEVRLDEEGLPVLSVVEVKNYPGRYADYEGFTAVSTHGGDPPGNLVKNLEALNDALQPTQADFALARDRASEAIGDIGLGDIAEMAEMGQMFWVARGADFEGEVAAEIDRIMADKLGITPDAYRQARNAMDARRIELLIRLAPETDIGMTGHRNAFGRLRADWEGLTGEAAIRNLRDQRVETLLPDFIEQAQAAMSAAQKLHQAGLLSSEALRYTGLPNAPFADASGNLLAVQRLRPADLASKGPAGVANEVVHRLTTPAILPSGSHREVGLVIDLSDLPGDARAAAEDAIRAELDGRGLHPSELARLVFVHQRIG